MKPTDCLIALFLLLSVQSNAKDSTAYAVTHKGDTILLHKKAYVQFEQHPQRIRNLDAAGKKQFIYADSLKILRISAYDANDGYARGMVTYTSFGIATTKGTCMHFGQEHFREKENAILTTPHCYRCTRLILYYRKGNGIAHAITKQNFREIINQYFNSSSALVEFANRKRYDAYTLLKLVQ